MNIKRNDGKDPNPLVKTGDINLIATRQLEYKPDGRFALVLPHEIKGFSNKPLQYPIVANDTETTSLDWQVAKIIGMGFGWRNPEESVKAYYLSGDPGDFEDLRSFYQHTEIHKVYHNAKYDLHILMNEGLVDEDIILNTKISDTMLMSYLIDENSGHKLKQLAPKFIEEGADRFEKLKDAFMKMNKCKTFAEVPLDLLADYGASDAYWTIELYYFYLPQLEQQGMLTPIADIHNDGRLFSLMEIEEALMKELFFQELIGVQMDIPYIEEYIRELEEQLPLAEQKVLDIAGDINIRSNDELYPKLVELGVHPSKFERTEKKKDPKINDDALELFINIYSDNKSLVEFIEAIQEIKGIEKQLETYLKNFIAMSDKDGRLHCSLNQHIARTGRLSSSEPNLQNIPKKYLRLRACFIANPGWNLVYFDFSQIEMRIFADYSNDPAMIEAFIQGRDLHEETIRELSGYTLEQWETLRQENAARLKELRSQGKTTNFSVVYGQGKKKTSDKLKMTKMIPVYSRRYDATVDGWVKEKVGEEPDYSEGLKFLRGYYVKFKGVPDLMEKSKKVISARGYIRNRFNRRRRLESKDSYKAVNALVQGCAADVLKVVLIRVAAFLRTQRKQYGYKSRLVLNIHDELILEMPDAELHLIPQIKRMMETWITPSFKVPIIADVEITNTNWSVKHKLVKDSRPEVVAIGEQLERGEY